MKKNLVCLLMIFVLGIVNIPVHSSASTGLNANEQELINFFEGGIDYEGKHYSIPSQYINQGINYLKQSGIEITDEQKSKVYQKVVEMTLEGIKQGYLVEDAPAAPTPTPTTAPGDENSDAGNDEAATPTPGKTKPGTDLDTGDKKSIPELIGSVKDLSDDLGVNIAYDAQKNNVSVINEQGKTVMLADKAIKNTGFRLNQTFGISLGLLLLFGISIQVARRYHLFAHDDET